MTDSDNCDRCLQSLAKGGGCSVYTTSWFTTETICMDCKAKEQEIRKHLPNHGHDFEGCGYIPTEKDYA